MERNIWLKQNNELKGLSQIDLKEINVYIIMKINFLFLTHFSERDDFEFISPIYVHIQKFVYLY